MSAWLAANIVMSVAVVALAITAGVRPDLRSLLANPLIWTSGVLAASSVSYLIASATV